MSPPSTPTMALCRCPLLIGGGRGLLVMPSPTMALCLRPSPIVGRRGSSVMPSPTMASRLCPSPIGSGGEPPPVPSSAMVSRLCPSLSLASSSTMLPCLCMSPFGGGGDPSLAPSLMMALYLRTPTRRREKASSFSSMMVTFFHPLQTMLKGTKSTAELAVSKLTDTGAATQGGPVPSRTLWDMPRGGRRAALWCLCSTGVNLVDSCCLRKELETS